MIAQADPETPSGKHRAIVIYCGLLLSVSAFSIDITLPLFTQLADDLNVPLARVPTTVTIYIGFMGVGQLFFGPLSDRLGRKPALFIGLLLFLCGAALAAIAQSFSLLLVARGMQGLGGAVAPVVARSILRDLFSGRELARSMALATGIFSIGPIIGPLLGGLASYLGSSWRLVFVGMLVYVGLLLVALFRLPETVRTRQPDALHPQVLWRNSVTVLTQPQSRYFLCVSMIVLTSMVLIVSESPNVYELEFGVTGILFALLFASHGVGIIIGQTLNHRLIGKIGEIRTAICAASMTTLATVLITLFSAAGWLSIYWLTFFVFLFAIGFLAVASNSVSLALGPHGAIAGFTSSLQGASSQIGAGVIATLLAWMLPMNASSWGFALFSISLLVLLMLLFWNRQAALERAG